MISTAILVVIALAVVFGSFAFLPEFDQGNTKDDEVDF